MLIKSQDTCSSASIEESLLGVWVKNFIKQVYEPEAYRKQFQSLSRPDLASKKGIPYSRWH